MGQWTLDDIAWDRFDPSRVDPILLKVAKAASLVERNARDYAAYLCSVFSDDPDFQDVRAIGPGKKCSMARRSPAAPEATPPAD